MPKKDSEVLAFTLRSPWRSTNRITGFRWRPTLISIWHTDPNAGWVWPNLSDFQESVVRWLASCEAENPWFHAHCGSLSVADAECLMRGLVVLLARDLKIKLSLKEAERLAVSMLHAPADHHRGNLFDADQYERFESADRLIHGVAREILKYKRPWYLHPRWQVCRWRIEADFVNDLRVFFTDGVGKLRNSESH